MNTIQDTLGVITIKAFLSSSECDALVQESESRGYDEATIQTSVGEQTSKQIRNNQRILFDNFDLAKRLFDKAVDSLPKDINYWRPVALNEKFRFYKYDQSQFFKWHVDGYYVKNYFEASKLTILVYLNDGYQGGETEFEAFKVSPEKGLALIFPHKLRHQSTPIVEGIKYVLRSDVMYAKE